jgi:hypothetical protein
MRLSMGRLRRRVVSLVGVVLLVVGAGPAVASLGLSLS